MSDRDPLVATGSQTIGPFFHFGLAPRPDGRLSDSDGGGEPITLKITVFDGDREPVTDAMIELWYSGVFGRMPTDAAGSCEFATVRPRQRSDGAASHVNVCLFARGLLRQLHTRIYFEADDDLASDRVLALVPEERRGTLLARRVEPGQAVWSFTIHLQGSDETVFFDV